MLVGNSGWLAADFRAVQASGAADLAQLWALGLAPGILSTITSATLLAATALASFRSGVLPRTLGYSAAVIAVGLLVGSVEPQGVSFLSPLWILVHVLSTLGVGRCHNFVETAWLGTAQHENSYAESGRNFSLGFYESLTHDPLVAGSSPAGPTSS
jgi:hypothetical protein